MIRWFYPIQCNWICRKNGTHVSQWCIMALYAPPRSPETTFILWHSFCSFRWDVFPVAYRWNNGSNRPFSIWPPWKYAETSKIEIFYFWRFGIFSWRPYWKWPIWPISPSICNRKHVPSGRTEKKCHRISVVSEDMWVVLLFVIASFNKWTPYSQSEWSDASTPIFRSLADDTIPSIWGTRQTMLNSLRADLIGKHKRIFIFGISCRHWVGDGNRPRERQGLLYPIRRMAWLQKTWCHKGQGHSPQWHWDGVLGLSRPQHWKGLCT